MKFLKGKTNKNVKMVIMINKNIKIIIITVALKVMPFVLLSIPAISEADAGGIEQRS